MEAKTKFIAIFDVKKLISSNGEFTKKAWISSVSNEYHGFATLVLTYHWAVMGEGGGGGGGGEQL